jgi:hypothetical protein
MTDQATAPAYDDAFYLELAGRAAMSIKSRRDLLRVVDGSRRMLGEKTARPPADLKIIRGKDQPCP